MENEHSHHDWQLNKVERPTLDQLFNDAWWWARDKGVSPAGNLANTHIWLGKLGESIAQAPFEPQKIMDEIGTCMVGLIAIAASLDINPEGCLDIAMKAHDLPHGFDVAKAYQQLRAE